MSEVSTRRCSKCDKAKLLTDFVKRKEKKLGRATRCKVCYQEACDNYVAKNQNKVRAYRILYYQNNKESIREKARLHRALNKNTVNEKYRKWENDRLAVDVEYRLQKNLRCRMRAILNGINKSKGTMELIGCSIKEFRDHIEKQFVDGMKWDNYGEWEIDHKIPLSWFRLEHEPCRMIAMNYKNCQPLWKTDNRRKHNRYHDV